MFVYLITNLQNLQNNKMQNFLRTWQEHWFVYNLAQLPALAIIEILIFSKITVFFFLYPSSKAY